MDDILGQFFKGDATAAGNDSKLFVGPDELRFDDLAQSCRAPGGPFHQASSRPRRGTGSASADAIRTVGGDETPHLMNAGPLGVSNCNNPANVHKPTATA